jgi:glycosyltransferase involved in cell wall biosynthesis
MSSPEHVLLIAFAYEPNQGSEPGIGWNTAHALARTHRVTVITCPGPELPRSSPVDVIRIAPPGWPASTSPKGNRTLWQFYYYSWTRTMASRLPGIIESVGADLVQHVTYNRYWMPSAGSTAGRPFVWGPVGGGEGMPDRFTESLPASSRRSQRFRSFIRSVWERDPALRKTADGATVALGTTAESAQRMQALTAARVHVCPAVGLSVAEMDRLAELPEPAGDGLELVSIGRMLDWKGFDLAVEALKGQHPTTRYTLIGDGPERARLEAQAERLGLGDQITFIRWIERAEVLERLGQADVLVHPSFHDSGGMVCLEAMAAGRPVVTLEGNGPGLLVGSGGLPVAAPTREAAVRGIRSAITRLAEDRGLRRNLGDRARERVRKEFSWTHRAEILEGYYSEAMDQDAS